MIGTLVLLFLLAIATWTDVREKKIYNGLTYPGMFLGLALAVVTPWWQSHGTSDVATGAPSIWQTGTVPWQEAVAGWLGCGLLMVVCFVFLPGGVGGGDVKLLAMIGAFLGPWEGLEALLWTFVLAGCVAVTRVVWKIGAGRSLLVAVSQIGQLVGIPARTAFRDEERKVLQEPLYISPAALAAVLIVQFPLLRQLGNL